ncbi:MAG: hypothetical protein JST01_19755 [Cyanobacteria bacterium SZAS TMP-1]|nr:hypothetical protein [Cyanobacteria bacterium SZAS TMP-1]
MAQRRRRTLRVRAATISLAAPLRAIILCWAALALVVIGPASQASWAGPAASPAAAPTSRLKAIQLQQTHYFLGKTQVTACQSGVRIDSTGRLQFALVARAPDWDVTVFRDDDKKFKRLSLKVFDIAGLMPQFVQSFRPRIVPSDAPPYEFKFFGFPARRVVNKYQNHEYIPIAGLAAPEAERVVFASYRLPTGGGLPLRYIGTAATRDFIGGINDIGHRDVALTTQTARTVFVTADFFAAPKNYKAARDMQEVVVSSQNREQSADFQNMFQTNDETTSPGRKTEIKHK